jgi:plastocyanin/mono/diheme cytochrome c family protein
MARSEIAAIGVLVIVAIGLPAATLGYHFGLFPGRSSVRTIDVVAAAPEQGGFQPNVLRIPAGETVRLRFSATDVTHGIAIGPGLDIDLGQVDPGQVKEVEATFDKPGRYTLYCNTWCSPNHWRMRATVEVYDPAAPDSLPAASQPDPVIAGLAERSMDIDAPHPAQAVPAARPSAARGAVLLNGAKLPSQLNDAAWRRFHSPSEAYTALKQASPGLDDRSAWDIVAFLWLKDLTAERRAWAAGQYARNCAACHGETGNGRGPGADALHAQGIGGPDHQHGGVPAAFTDPHTMLGGTSATYYAKLRRGGMGTGMPDFGPIFTEDETRALVNFLWSFQFDH